MNIFIVLKALFRFIKLSNRSFEVGIIKQVNHVELEGREYRVRLVGKIAHNHVV
ncbi:hypothetical protein D3C85_1454200 [compost metagenome]